MKGYSTIQISYTGKKLLAQILSIVVVTVFMLVSAPETEALEKMQEPQRSTETFGGVESGQSSYNQPQEAVVEKVVNEGESILVRDVDSTRMKMKASKVKSNDNRGNNSKSVSGNQFAKDSSSDTSDEFLTGPDKLVLVTGAEENYGEEIVEYDMEVSVRTQKPLTIGQTMEETFCNDMGASREVQRMVCDTIPENAPKLNRDFSGMLDCFAEDGVSGNGIHEAVSGNGMALPDADEQIEVAERDMQIPQLIVEQETFNKLQFEDTTIFCSNEPTIQIKAWDEPTTADSGIGQVYCAYGDKLIYATEQLESARFSLLEEFYGQVQIQCKDNSGNTSETVSGNYLIENNAPEVDIAVASECVAPYTMWVSVSESGSVSSGIQQIWCTVNGETTEVTDYIVKESILLAENFAVPDEVYFPIAFEEVGEYTVSVKVLDNAGNEKVEERTVNVEKPDLVAVYMPEHFTIHIDPQQLNGREQIYSDDITLTNVSECDVRVNIDEVTLHVNDEISDTGVVKDCEIYMIAPDTGEKILLQKGNNTSVYSYKLPMEAVGDVAAIRFVGSITEDSDEMWVGSDLAIDVKVSFEKWRE